MRIIIREREVFESEREKIISIRVDLHHRKRAGFSSELFTHLIKMIVVDVYISECMHKLPRTKPRNLGDHTSEQCIRGYIERYPEKNIC